MGVKPHGEVVPAPGWRLRKSWIFLSVRRGQPLAISVTMHCCSPGFWIRCRTVLPLLALGWVCVACNSDDDRGPVEAPGVDATCASADAPYPRRLVRLSNSEMIASLRELAPLANEELPRAFRDPNIPPKPNANLSVSRDFYDQLDGVAVRVAEAVTTSARDLTCDVASFGREAGCTEQFVTRFGNRALRGVFMKDDATPLVELAGRVAARSGGKAALTIVVRALVLSPKSVYLLEGFDRTPERARAAAPLSPAEMASYLSFRINGGPPSAAFIEALARLSSPTVESVRAVLSEHFGDESIRRSASSFLSTWLDVPRLSDIARDEVKHPENTADYAVQLQRETYDVLLGFVAGDAPTFSALLTRPFRSDHVADPTSDTFGSVGRPGVLSLPGVLAAASSINHTNVPRRGRFILKSLFCETLPNPPPNAITQQPPLPETASERERFERVEQKAGCGGCHERINRIAYPFEVYDELGRTRLKDEGRVS